ncbi:MAG: threonine--tRNA ligase [Thermoleophilia bacterium]|nr:threonine--tRNA ligase [Thermoleophilia bacterium]
MKVVLPDETELELADGSTGLDAARAIGPKLAEQAVLVRADGERRDLRLPLPDGARIQILTSRDRDDPDALYVLRHSAAHLLAEAARRLYPGTKVAIGPPIEHGFYYDFEFPEPVGEEALERLEEEIRREIAEGRTFERREVDRDEARRIFEAEGEPYKVELVDTAEGALSFYRQGDFTDLCRGPHLQTAAPIRAVKLLSLAGAYWRGDERNPQLTRIYGTAFYDQRDLDAHLRRLEEARRRDHRRLGRQLGLIEFSELAPGMPFWHPRGMVVWNVLEDLRRRENARRGYREIRTPQLYDADLWKTSGHWDKFRDDMFALEIEHRDFGLKPMNCPGHCLLYAQAPRSYRDLPLRLAEAGNLHRNELSGVLHGLLRVRHFVQDDAHIFCTREQIQDELLGCLDYAFFLYDLFGLELRVELSTRPANKLGTDEEWDFAEAALQTALAARDLEAPVSAGEGSFYGPKIDLHMTDSLGRSWQLGTVQLDLQMPKRFGLVYAGSDNAEHTPAMIHRALLGSFERFLGVYLEHTAGELPVWLAPVQARVIPVADDHDADARELAAELAARDVRADLDTSAETLGKRIRNAELEKLPYVIVLGDKERSGGTLALRIRGERAVVERERAAALDEIAQAARL